MPQKKVNIKPKSTFDFIKLDTVFFCGLDVQLPIPQSATIDSIENPNTKSAICNLWRMHNFMLQIASILIQLNGHFQHWFWLAFSGVPNMANGYERDN